MWTSFQGGVKQEKTIREENRKQTQSNAAREPPKTRGGARRLSPLPRSRDRGCSDPCSCHQHGRRGRFPCVSARSASSCSLHARRAPRPPNKHLPVCDPVRAHAEYEYSKSSAVIHEKSGGSLCEEHCVRLRARAGSNPTGSFCTHFHIQNRHTKPPYSLAPPPLHLSSGLKNREAELGGRLLR